MRRFFEDSDNLMKYIVMFGWRLGEFNEKLNEAFSINNGLLQSQPEGEAIVLDEVKKVMSENEGEIKQNLSLKNHYEYTQNTGVMRLQEGEYINKLSPLFCLTKTRKFITSDNPSFRVGENPFL